MIMKKKLIFESLRSESEKAHQEKCSLCVAVWTLWEPNRQLILFAVMVLRQGESKPKNQIKGYILIILVKQGNGGGDFEIIVKVS